MNHVFMTLKSQEDENNYESHLQAVPSEIFCVFKTQLAEEYFVEEKPININTTKSDRELNEVNF